MRGQNEPAPLIPQTQKEQPVQKKKPAFNMDAFGSDHPLNRSLWCVFVQISFWIILSFENSIDNYMADILPNVGLSKLFSSRIRNYFLFLEVTNNIELICEITQYLNIRDLISFLSASTHTYSFSWVTNI